MPRTCTPTERATIAGAGVNHYLYLSVADADGVMKDVTALGTLGLDFLDGATWSETLDEPVSRGTLTIRRATNDDTAAPLMGSSSINRNALGQYAPLFEKGRAVLVSTATVAPGATPGPSDKKPMFTGRIDAVDWQDDPMTIQISDIGAWVVDAFIQAPKQYITPAAPGSGDLLGVVLQNMLNDATTAPIKDAPVTLYEPVTCPFQPYSNTPIQPQSLLAAMRAVAQETGWEVRYRYDASDVFRLTLYQPDRTNTTPDWVIGPSEYTNVTKLETSIADIRNLIKGIYNVNASGAPSNVVTSSDAASIAKYGTRFMQVNSSLITNAADMQKLTDAIVSDLSEASADQEIEMPYFWPVQIGDLITFQANGDHYDSDQTIAVVGYTHSFQGGEGKTTIQARGHVAGAYRAWFVRANAGVDGGDPADSLEGFTWTDSTDGTQRTFTWTRGAMVDAVWVYETTVTAPVDIDPFAWGGVFPSAVLRAGQDTFTVTKPVHGEQVFLQFEPRIVDTTSGTVTTGTVRRAVVDPMPSAMAVKIRRTVTNALADLEVEVDGAPSDWPIVLDVYEADPDGTPIVSATFTQHTVIDKTMYPALGGRALPQRQMQHWWAEVENVGGMIDWDTAAADRDPLAVASVTVIDYEANPLLFLPVDTDCDSVRFTVPGGKTKTILTPAGTTSAQYKVGDVLDDLSVENAFKVDESRTGYKVEVLGGGTWLTVWGNGAGQGVLHGEASNPPTIEIVDVGLSPNGDTASPSFVVSSPVGEQVGLYLKNAEGVSAPIYNRTPGSGSTAIGYVPSGTTIGPADYFSAGGTPVQKLSAIPLVRDQVTRIYMQVVGKDSGVESPWIPVALDLKNEPWLESTSGSFDTATSNLRERIRGGAKCQSVYVEAANVPDFTSGTLTPQSIALTDGGDITALFNLSSAQAQGIWYLRATPYNGPLVAGAVSGLAGQAQVCEVEITAGPSLTVQTVVSDTQVAVAWAGTGIVTRSVDGGAFSTPPASPYTVARDAAEHRHTFEAVRAGETKSAEAVIPQLAGSGAATPFTFTAIELFDQTAQTIRTLWSWSGDPSVTFDIYVDDGVGSFTFSGSAAAGATHYDHTSSFPSAVTDGPSGTPVVFRAYVQAKISNWSGPSSDPTSTTLYH